MVPGSTAGANGGGRGPARWGRPTIDVLTRRVLRAGVSLWLACATVLAEPLRFADISLDTPLSTLSARFPRSRHQFMDTDGRIRERTDSLEEFAELLAQGSGHYDVRLDADDAPSPVVSISVDVARGLTRRIPGCLSKSRTTPWGRRLGASNAGILPAHRFWRASPRATEDRSARRRRSKNFCKTTRIRGPLHLKNWPCTAVNTSVDGRCSRWRS